MSDGFDGHLDLERFEALYAALGVRTVRAGGHLWREYQRMAVPVGPAAWDYRLPEDEARSLLRSLPGALLVRETGGFDSEPLSDRPWFVVVRDAPIEGVSGEAGRQIRRGMERVRVEPVTSAAFPNDAHRVLVEARSRYRGWRPPEERAEALASRFAVSRAFPGLMQFWAAYTDRLVGWAVTFNFGAEWEIPEVVLSPEARRDFASHALYTTLTNTAFKEGATYVNVGTRSLLHETGIQDFAIETLGFRRAGFRSLQLRYRQPFGLIRLAHPLSSLVGRLDPRLRALLAQDRIARSYRRAR